MESMIYLCSLCLLFSLNIANANVKLSAGICLVVNLSNFKLKWNYLDVVVICFDCVPDSSLNRNDCVFHLRTFKVQSPTSTLIRTEFPV